MFASFSAIGGRNLYNDRESQESKRLPYSFESWSSLSEAPEEDIRKTFPFSEDLKALEESVPFGFSEGMAGFERPEPPRAPEPVMPDTAQWGEIARIVADHVMNHMTELQHPLQTSLDKSRRQADEYYRDNRAMAVQIQKLLSEREQMAHALRSYELEIARYRNLLGNLYLKI
jgi:hypothetical protein